VKKDYLSATFSFLYIADIILMLTTTVYLSPIYHYIRFFEDLIAPTLLISLVFPLLTIAVLPVFIYRRRKKTISIWGSNAVFILSLAWLVMTVIFWRTFISAAASGV